MNNTKEILNEYLLKMLEAVEKGAEFAITNIPEVLMEYVSYKAFMNWVWIFFSGALLVLSIHMIRTGKKREEQGRDGDFMYILGGVILVASMVGIPFAFKNAIAATFFPEVYLLQKALDLVNCGC